jgi:hypothetical protein
VVTFTDPADTCMQVHMLALGLMWHGICHVGCVGICQLKNSTAMNLFSWVRMVAHKQHPPPPASPPPHLSTCTEPAPRKRVRRSSNSSSTPAPAAAGAPGDASAYDQGEFFLAEGAEGVACWWLLLFEWKEGHWWG